MATQGTPLVTPFSLAAIELLGDNLGTPLAIPFEMVSVNALSGTNFIQRFPTPPSVGSFLTDVEIEMAFDRIQAPYVFTGAVYPESPFLEPTIGQIWPR